MDNPGNSLFQNTEINLNKSRNEEEEEDLADQMRRNEELQNLVRTKLDDFSYDESTVNSSIVSAISCDDAQKNYLKANNQQEQLQVLYDIRLRELKALQEEHKETVEKMTRNMDTLKKKLTLSEAELEQIKISYKNTEALLVEKNGAIKELTAVLESKESQIQEYQKIIDNMNLEISTYRTTINDLHLKIQAERNPFNNGNKQFNSEEYKASVQEKLGKLEALLEEETKTAKLMEKENITLKEELTRLISIKNDDASLMKALTNNFESAQKQCEELINVIETLSNENKHLQERLSNIYNTSGSERNSLDNSNLTHQMDKLKKLLVDKTFQINSLSAKLRNYEENLKELLEYRKLKADSYQKEFKQCENQDHTKNLILMQNDLQNYRRIIEDKNQQILHLNSTNKDLLAKMEETLSQTRNDIKNFSNKYSLPQLEKMAEDLKASQNKILCLEQKLKESEEKNAPTPKETNKESELKKEIEALKLISEKEKTDLKNQLTKLKQELDVTLSELKNLKKYTDELVAENVHLKSQTKIEGIEDKSVKENYLQSVKALQEAKEQIQSLQETVDELTNVKTITEGERYTYESDIKTYKYQLENCQSYASQLELELENVEKELKTKEEMVENLQETVKNLKQKVDVNREIEIQLENTLKELKTKEEAIANFKREISSLEEKLSSIENIKDTNVNRKELNECINCKISKEQVLDEDQKGDIKTVRKNLIEELNAIEEEALEKNKEADMLTLEIKLREEIQEEYFNKLKDIEKNYEKVYNSNKDLKKEHEEKLKLQDAKFREHLSIVLRECTQKIKEYEEGSDKLIYQLRNLQSQNEQYKQQIEQKEKFFKQLLEEIQSNSQKDTERWKSWSQKLLSNCLKVETINKKSRENILSKMKTYDLEVAAVEKSFGKIMKMVKEKR